MEGNENPKSEKQLLSYLFVRKKKNLQETSTEADKRRHSRLRQTLYLENVFIYKEKLFILIIKLDALRRHINHTTSIASPLLLVLLLREAFALRDDQVSMRLVRIVIRHIRVAGEPGVDLLVMWDPRETAIIEL